MKRWLPLLFLFLFAAAALTAQPGAPRAGGPAGLGPPDAGRAGISSACIERSV
jgi:hypothetical protein